MGSFSTRVNGLIKNARRAFDEVRHNFNETFGSPDESQNVPSGMFEDGIVVITPNEVNDRHGTGVILGRAFAGVPKVLSIRSTDLHGDHQFGEYSILFSHLGFSRVQSYAQLLSHLQGNSFRYVVCVPYHADELLSAIVLKDSFGARLCVYVMDDNHLETGQIPEDLMREALTKADLRLAISPEMRDAYENRYRLKFWLRPPVVTPDAISKVASLPSEEILERRRGIVVGSLWSTQSLERLVATVSQAGLQVDWFGNSNAPWLNYDINDLASKGVIVRGFIPETDLAHKIRDYTYALVPSGTLEPGDLRTDIAKYSLPTRMPFLLAVGNIPTIVLGSHETAAAGFVERFGIGEIVTYSGARLREAVERLSSPMAQKKIRERAASLAESFSARGVGEWILKALETGKPDGERMEDLMARRISDFAYYLDPPAPANIVPDFAPVYLGLSRLKRYGFDPDFVLDVGASTGIWSISVSEIFQRSRYFLIEPLLELYGEKIGYARKSLPSAEIIGAAMGDRPGRACLKVSSDLYGSSLLDPSDGRSYRDIDVPLITLDQLAAEKNIQGRGLLKMDVQQAEHLVLEGAKGLLPRIDVLIAELSLYRLAKGGKTLTEMVGWLEELGFSFFDEVGEWRCPQDGRLLQKDLLFVRQGLFPYRLALS
jgi:FkbM family methyltransferase